MTGLEKNELCLRIYQDIINGYSILEEQGATFYIKHLRDIDYALFEQKKEAYRQEATSRGLLSSGENLQMLIDTGHWSWPEESQYEALLAEIDNLKKTESQIFLDSQRKVIAARTKKKEEELEVLGKYRNLLPLSNTEGFATEKLNSFIMRFCFYKAADLKENLFTEKEFDNLHMEEVNNFTNLYFGNLSNFSEKNIKRISCLGIFINSFMLGQANPYYFFGKKICDLSNYQTSLCSHGCSQKNVLENSENTMPAYTDIDDSVAWLERERDIIKNKYSKSKSPPSAPSGGTPPKTERLEGISVPNASQEEMESIGFEKGAQPMNLVEAAEKLKKKLGKDSLDIHDMVKLHS